METKKITVKEFFELLKEKKGDLRDLQELISIKDEVYFHGEYTYPIYLRNIQFEQIVMFNDSVFEEIVDLENSIFKNNVNCGRAYFKKNFYFSKSHHINHFYCNECVFEKDVYLQQVVVDENNFQLNDAKFLGRCDCKQHEHIAKKLLYYKMGLII